MASAEWGTAFQADWPEISFDQWTHLLRSICGRFDAEPIRGRATVRGGLSVSTAGGVEMAKIGLDLEVVRRTPGNVRADDDHYLFLISQLEGACGIEQNDRRLQLEPGDWVLIDSAAPSAFHFQGRFSNHLSLHLPRRLLLGDGPPLLDVARKIGRNDPMSSVLLALAAKLRQQNDDVPPAEGLRRLLYDAVRQSFGRNEREAGVLMRAGGRSRLELAWLLVDRHITDPKLTPQWLADRVGASLRSLQRDFDALGYSVTTYIRHRRLCLVRDQLGAMRQRGDERGISNIAFACGFNDISYFNRSFREAFGCSPREFLVSETKIMASEAMSLAFEAKTEEVASASIKNKNIFPGVETNGILRPADRWSFGRNRRA